MSSRKILGYSLIVLAAACWGLIGPVAKSAYAEGVKPLEVAFWRALLGSLLFFVHFFFSRRRDSARRATPLLGSRRDVAAYLGFGILGVAIFYGSFLYAVEKGGAGFAAILLYTAPIWVFLFQTVFPDRPSRISTSFKLVAVSASIIGILLINGGVSFGHWKPLAAGLIAGFCYSLYYIQRRLFSADITVVQMFAGSLLVGALCLYPWVDFASKGARTWVAVSTLALVSTYFAFLCLSSALERVGDPSLVAIVATIEPVFAAVLDFVMWSQAMSLLQSMGFAVILGVSFSILLKDRKELSAHNFP